MEEKGDHFKIIVTELPYQVRKAALIASIADLVKDKRLEGISGIKDFTNRKGMHIEISVKRDANAQVVLNNLYKMTQMQVTFGVIMLALVDGVPKILNLKQMLQNYIKFREEVITRRTKYDLNKAMARAHILDGLRKAIDIVDEIIATIRSCKGGKSEAKLAIMEKFGFDDPQATAIVNFQLGQLAGLEIEKITNELAELKEKIADYEDILANESRVFDIIKSESQEIVNKFDDDRRTEISPVIGSVDDEDLIPVEESILTLTNMGYMKRMTVDTYKAQNRGGRGIMGMSRREEDVAKTMFSCSSHDVVFLFTNTGKVFRKKAYEIPASSRTGKGMNVVNLLPLEKGETVSAMVKIPEDENRRYLCMVTKKGVIKRTDIDEYKHIRQSGIIAVNLDEGDELAYVEITDGNRNLVVATHNGMSICFNEADARLIGRTARGVRAIALAQGDYVVGFAAQIDGFKLLTVSETGFGRKSEFSDYRVQSRGGKGLINYRCEQFGKVAMIAPVSDDNDVIMITSDGIVIRTHADQISTFLRPSKGVKVMKVNEGEKIATISIVDRFDEEADGETTEESGEASENADNASTAEAAPAEE